MNSKKNGVRELFKSIKHRSPCQIFCPKCGSPKIKCATGLTIGGLAPRQYHCECGYVGTIVMELEEDTNAENQKQKKETKT